MCIPVSFYQHNSRPETHVLNYGDERFLRHIIIVRHPTTPYGFLGERPPSRKARVRSAGTRYHYPTAPPIRALRGGRGPTRKAIVRSRQITGGFPNCTSLLPLRTSAKSGHGDVSTSTGFTVFWKQHAPVMIDRNKTTCVFFPVRICEKDKYSKDVNTNNLYSNVQIGCTSIGLHREVSSRFLSICVHREVDVSAQIHRLSMHLRIVMKEQYSHGYPCICVAQRDACCCKMRVSTPTHVALFARICLAYECIHIYM